MKRILSVFMFMLSFVIAGRCAMPIEMENLRIHSRCMGMDVGYSIVLPADYVSSGKKYPVVFLLHGIGGDNSTWIEYSDIARLAAISGMQAIYVMPDGFQSYYCNSFDSSQKYETFLLDELVPYLERNYPVSRRKCDKALIGFSMGGFGALSLYLRHSDLFAACVALSPSIRTDAQYISEEPQKDWNRQWGRIFGGIGKEGNDRITDYYRLMSPCHILKSMSMSQLQNLHLRIDVGDKEGTLLDSNEKLHRLLLDCNVVHEWNVRSGGHDFDCWNAAMPEALEFVARELGLCHKVVDSKEIVTYNVSFDEYSFGGCKLFVPRRCLGSIRRCPVVYLYSRVDGNFMNDFLAELTKLTEIGQCRPMAICFIPESMTVGNAISLTESSETKRMLRCSQRMRAFIGFGNAANNFFESLSKENYFSAAVLVDASLDMPADSAAMYVRSYSRYPHCFFSTMATWQGYTCPSSLHSAFRRLSLSHEFRSKDYFDKYHVEEWKEWILYLDKRFHI